MELFAIMAKNVALLHCMHIYEDLNLIFSPTPYKYLYLWSQQIDFSMSSDHKHLYLSSFSYFWTNRLFMALIGWWSRGTICNNGKKRGTLSLHAHLFISVFHPPHLTSSPQPEYKYTSFQIILKSLCFKILTSLSSWLCAAKCKMQICEKVEVSWVIHLRRIIKGHFLFFTPLFLSTHCCRIFFIIFDVVR